MQNRKGIVYPRIAEEIVDYAELQEVLGVSYLTAYRIMHGHAFPNHKRKKTLSSKSMMMVPQMVIMSSLQEMKNRFI